MYRCTRLNTSSLIKEQYGCIDSLKIISNARFRYWVFTYTIYIICVYYGIKLAFTTLSENNEY